MRPVAACAAEAAKPAPITTALSCNSTRDMSASFRQVAISGRSDRSGLRHLRLIELRLAARAVLLRREAQENGFGHERRIGRRWQRGSTLDRLHQGLLPA